ncbi:MAG: sulfurtransferase TusA family protein [Nitrospirae bacterium]|nr:sulfurtransferase TusA family protein [Nitrospirota bacterium]
MDDFSIDKVVDTRGSLCPGPIMALIEAVKLADINTVIEFFFEDEQSVKDASLWINKVGNQLLVNETVDGYFRIVVKKVK